MLTKLILGILGILLFTSLVVAQLGISFPHNFEINLSPLPPPQSANQLLWACPYDRTPEYRFNGVRELVWEGNIPKVRAEIMYWTQSKDCAGSVSLNLTLPITLSQQQLVTNYEQQVNVKFMEEALANRQPRQEGYIAGSGGLLSSGASVPGGSGA